MIRKYLLTIIFTVLPVTGLMSQQLFPNLKGYRINNDYPVYTPDDLWNYINGAADAYLMLGFADLEIREYVKGRNSIKAEIYRFGDDAMAFGIYSMERSPGYAFIQVGVQGYNEEGAVHFYKDRYYVKIMSHSHSPKVNESMLELARLIASNIGGKNEFPSLLKLFPEEGLLKNQENFLLESVLGHEFLRGAFRASYEVDGDRFDIYLFSSVNPAETDAMAAALAGDAWSDDEETFKYAFEDGFNGMIYMARMGVRLVVVTGLSIEKAPMAERYIMLMLSR
jgi:hypothetical protein